MDGVIYMIAKLRDRSQLTLPSEVMKKLKLHTGDKLDITVEGDKIILKPVLIIDRTQAWFWSEKWQKKEMKADMDIKNGRVSRTVGIDDLLEELDSE
jgi:antitoxin MazE